MMRWVVVMVLSAAAAAQSAPSPQSVWEISPCPHLSRRDWKKGAGGQALFFRLPRGAKAKAYGGTDTASVDISYPKDRTQVAHFETGPTLGGDNPPTEFIDASVSRSERIILTTKGAFGKDFRGTTKDGRSWRKVGTPWDKFEYWNVTREAADYFDAIFDNACSLVERY